MKTGFDRFFASLKETARQRGSSIEAVAAKDGISAYRKAARTHSSAWNILLKDSEMPVPADRRVLCNQHGIDSSHVDDVFWMVELMESWFLAHPEVLEGYYSLPAGTIRRTADVEQIRKSDVERRLKDATRNTSKGEYRKVKHAPFLLEGLDADQVQARASHCRRLFESVKQRL